MWINSLRMEEKILDDLRVPKEACDQVVVTAIWVLDRQVEVILYCHLSISRTGRI